ncbi:putative 7-deoxyloganetin glucosyltransferase [Helianthus anomalus]
MESIVEGVPMVCWPYFGDQQTNSRFVGEVWKTEIDLKDTCDRLGIEKAVRDIMDSKHKLYTQVANTWENVAKESISKTGSSSIQLARLIDDILAMSLTNL